MSEIVFPEFKTQLSDSGNDLALQCCEVCGQVNYPPRELCGNCLCDTLCWLQVEATGSVQALTLLRHSMEAAFNAALPMQIVSVRMDAGPVLICHGTEDLQHGQNVLVSVMQDRDGNHLLFATDAALDKSAVLQAWNKTKLS